MGVTPLTTYSIGYNGPDVKPESCRIQVYSRSDNSRLRTIKKPRLLPWLPTLSGGFVSRRWKPGANFGTRRFGNSRTGVLCESRATSPPCPFSCRRVRFSVPSLPSVLDSLFRFRAIQRSVLVDVGQIRAAQLRGFRFRSGKGGRRLCGCAHSGRPIPYT